MSLSDDVGGKMSNQVNISLKKKHTETVYYKIKTVDIVIIISDKGGGQNNRKSLQYDAMLNSHPITDAACMKLIMFIFCHGSKRMVD